MLFSPSFAYSSPTTQRTPRHNGLESDFRCLFRCFHFQLCALDSMSPAHFQFSDRPISSDFANELGSICSAECEQRWERSGGRDRRGGEKEEKEEVSDHVACMVRCGVDSVPERFI